MNSNEYRHEQHHVDLVLREINRQIKAVQNEYHHAHNSTKQVLKNYGNDTSVNYFEVDDRNETMAELEEQRWMASEEMRTEHVVHNHLYKLKQLNGSPYFGRIDLKFPGDNHPLKLYIGTASCVDAHDHFLVFDWRAPIASVYYNGTLGKVAYHTPAGRQVTDLKKKRQFLIKNGKIRNMFDTNEIVGDEMLQHVLGQKNDRVMHNIVATIQHDQNDIIRDTQSDLLVVQGVAGSGKTSAILQRIAFLLYHDRNSLNVSQILLFSPNRLFSHYISDVLPSLGEHNMRQVTLADFLSKRFEGLRVQTIFERYESTHKLTPDQIKIRKFKNSARFMRAVKKYCRKLKANQFAFSPILYNGRIFFGKETIKLLYASEPAAVKSQDKFLHVKNQLIIMLKNRINAEAETKPIQKQVDNLSSDQYNEFFTGTHAKDIRSMSHQRHYIAYRIAKNHLARVYNAIFNNEFFDPYIQYQDFLCQVKLPKGISKAAWQQSIKAFDHDLEFHRLTLDNATPLLYLRDLITGEGLNHDIKYLFVDEMQDYSIAQLVYMKHAFPRAKLNLIGDSEQALFKNVQAPRALLKQLNSALSARHPRLIKLNRSYRSTYPITNFAKALLPDGNQIQAFNRAGDLPRIVIRYNWNSAIKATQQIIHQQLKKNNTVAILTQHLKEAKEIYTSLHVNVKKTLMSDTDRSLPQGVLIMPIYLAKGLEFDSVIAWNVSKDNYNHHRLLGTLYTIATRAMHNLTLLSIGPVSPLITKSNVSPKQFTINHQLN
ncbi:MAG: ATP-dependent DNA helicase [Acetilactobacillus jinshanensis]